MKGHVRKRCDCTGRCDHTWTAVAYLGESKFRQCPTCSGARRYWEGETVPDACPKCAGPLEVGLGSRQQWKSGFQTRREADEWVRRILHQADEGTFVAPAKLTVGEWWDQWAKLGRELKPSTWESHARNFRVYARPRIGGVRLQDLKPLQLSTMYADLLASGGRYGKPLSAGTVTRLHAVVHKLLSDAVRQGLLVANPAARAKVPAAGVQAEDEDFAPFSIWDADQIRQFLTAAQEHRLFPLWRLLVVTYCRRGEALAPTWNELDLDAGTFRIHRTLGDVGGQLVYGTPKTRKGRRTLTLDPETVRILRDHKRRQAEELLAFGIRQTPQTLVFARLDEPGRPYPPKSISATFRRLTDRAGLPTIRLHDLRHSGITLAIQQDVPIKVVSERAGHSTTAFTQDVYAAVLPAMDAAAADLLAAALDQ